VPINTPGEYHMMLQKAGHGRVCYWAYILSLVLGTTGLFGVAGCDSDLSTAMLSSLEDMATSLVDFAFQAIADQVEEDSTTTTTSRITGS